MFPPAPPLALTILFPLTLTCDPNQPHLSPQPQATPQSRARLVGRTPTRSTSRGRMKMRSVSFGMIMCRVLLLIQIHIHIYIYIYIYIYIREYTHAHTSGTQPTGLFGAAIARTLQLNGGRRVLSPTVTEDRRIHKRIHVHHLYLYICIYPWGTPSNSITKGRC